jgi:hypothetical protein
MGSLWGHGTGSSGRVSKCPPSVLHVACMCHIVTISGTMSLPQYNYSEHRTAIKRVESKTKMGGFGNGEISMGKEFKVGHDQPPGGVPIR